MLGYYDRLPEPIDRVARRIGYRIYPSFIWAFERDGMAGSVIGLAKNRVAPPLGVMRLEVADP